MSLEGPPEHKKKVHLSHAARRASERELSNAPIGHAIRRGLTPITVGLGQVRDRSYRSRAKIRMPAASNWNLIAPSLWG